MLNTILFHFTLLIYIVISYSKVRGGYGLPGFLSKCNR